ncbi:MAG: amidohydrolase family protein [Pirellulales bacterium]
MLIAGHLLLPAAADRVRLERGWLRLDGPRIVEVAAGDPPGKPDLGGDDHFVSPGLIDAHCHLPQFRVIGFDGLPLLEWLERGVFPEEARWDDPLFAAQKAERAFRQMLSFGTTGCCAYATVHAHGARQALEIAETLGLRTAVGQVLMDRLAPETLLRPTTQLLHECAELAERYSPESIDAAAGKRSEFVVSPRFAITCTPELMMGAAEIGAKFGNLMQTHLSENAAECRFVESLFPGRNYTQVYGDCGLLGPRTLFGHGIHLHEDERALLQGTGSIVAHCPVANNFLQSGVMPRAVWLQEGIRLALGSDVGAGTERSMIRVARAMLETAKTFKLENPDAALCSAAEAWHTITAGNAAKLGWNDCGRLVTGGEADVLIAHPDIDWLHAPDPLAVLLYAWDDRWLKRTIACGKVGYAARDEL